MAAAIELQTDLERAKDARLDVMCFHMGALADVTGARLDRLDVDLVRRAVADCLREGTKALPSSLPLQQLDLKPKTRLAAIDRELHVLARLNAAPLDSYSKPSSRIALGVLACQIENSAADVADVELFLDGAALERGFRHAIDDAGLLVLADRARAGLTHRKQPCRAILAHAGEDSADRVATHNLGHRLEQHVDRGAMTADRFARVKAATEIARASDLEMRDGSRRQINAARRQRRAFASVRPLRRCAKALVKVEGMCAVISVGGQFPGKREITPTRASTHPVEAPIATYFPFQS